jgi:hypothetical protein
MLIYNRWGEIIFETRDPNVGWDASYGPDHLNPTFIIKLKPKNYGLVYEK